MTAPLTDDELDALADEVLHDPLTVRRFGGWLSRLTREQSDWFSADPSRPPKQAEMVTQWCWVEADEVRDRMRAGLAALCGSAAVAASIEPRAWKIVMMAAALDGEARFPAAVTVEQVLATSAAHLRTLGG